MSECNFSELLSKRCEKMKTCPKSTDRRKKKKKMWKNAYAEIVYEYFEQINELVNMGDSIFSLFEFFQNFGFFTRDANYTFFSRAFVREKQRREKSQVGKNQSPRLNLHAKKSDKDVDENSIKPRRDRKEF